MNELKKEISRQYQSWVELFMCSIKDGNNLLEKDYKNIYSSLSNVYSNHNFRINPFENLFDTSKKFEYFDSLINLFNKFRAENNENIKDRYFASFFYEFYIHYESSFNEVEKTELIENIVSNSSIPLLPSLVSKSDSVETIRKNLGINNNEQIDYSFLPDEEELFLPILAICNRLPNIRLEKINEIVLKIFPENNLDSRLATLVKIKVKYTINILKKAELLHSKGLLPVFILTQKGELLLGLKPTFISNSQLLKIIMNYPLEEVFRFYDRFD